jgi:[protein-PII] uridylyltransferase
VKKLVEGRYAAAEPGLNAIVSRVADFTWLFLAALLHDVGKSAGKNHALHGGEMVPAIARRLGLNPTESDIVQFLVAQHLLLMDSASLRDLADEEMLAQCALIIGTCEQLDQLTLLSFADMMATGPRAQQKWRDTPVLALYERVNDLLERGDPNPQTIAERIEHVRMQVGQEVTDLIGSAELEDYLAQLVPRYLLSMPPGAIARHFRLEWQLQRGTDPFVWEVAVADDLAEITLLSPERPGLLARTAGILTLHDLNIISAQVFTKKNGVVLLIFQCRLPEPADAHPDWNEVKADMGRLLQGKLALDYRIAAHAVTRMLPRPSVRQSPSHIKIDNDSSNIYTILEVYTLDRVGLLYTITRTLHDLQLRIYVAKITTKVDQVADVFYLRTNQGEKVTDPEQVREIKNALCFWLDGPELTCTSQ